MSKPARTRKRMPHKALPTAPSRNLPLAPSTITKPRAQSYDNVESTSTYTTTYSYGRNDRGLTYTTTYASESHPWAVPSKPLKKLPNKVPILTQPKPMHKSHTAPMQQSRAPATTISFNAPDSSGTTYTMTTTWQIPNGNDTPTRNKRAMTYTSHLNHTTNQTQKHRASYHAPLPLDHDIVNKEIEYSINDHVDLNDNRQGIIRFIGEISVELNGAIWYGIELTEPKGTNNGTLKGVTYFRCEATYGTFVERKTIRWLSSEYSANVDLDSIDRFHINQIVNVKGKKGSAQIRFIGLWGDNLKYGLELLDDTGTHSGVVDDKFYFSCGIYRGIFVNESDLIVEDDEDEENDFLTTLPMLNRFGNSGPDSDDSMDSDTESVCSMSSVSDVRSDVFGHVRLNEAQTDMAFTQILNKFKYVERGQPQTENANAKPRPSVLDIGMDREEIDLIMHNYHSQNQDQIKYNDYDLDEKEEETPDEAPLLFLSMSKTSVAKDQNIDILRHSLSNNMAMDDALDTGCMLEDADDDEELQPIQTQDSYRIQGPPPKQRSYEAVTHNTNEDSYQIAGPPRTARQPQKMSIVVSPANKHTRNKHRNELANILETTNDATPHAHPAVPEMISTEVPSRPASVLSPFLSPLDAAGQQTLSNELSLHSNPSLHLDTFVLSEDECHLKKEPEDPYDVCTTEREFTNTAEIIQMGCNNPYKLLKILKAMTGKLYHNDMKYRSLAINHRLRLKLLNYDGVEEFLKQIGFEKKDNGNTLECPLDQPPMSVLNAALNVCNSFISKCRRGRALIDTIKKFNPSALTPITPDEHHHEEVEMDEEETVVEDTETDDGGTHQGQHQQDHREETPNAVRGHKYAVRGESNKTPTPSEIVPPPPIDTHDITSPIKAKEEAEAKAIEATLDAVYDNDDGVEQQDTPDDELEGEDDRFQLDDIIASITHEDNNDHSIQQIILLCYITFTDALQLFQCLDRRFFGCGGSWTIQNKVIFFVVSWMKQYWNEDWGNVMLLMSMESFIKKIQSQYANNAKYTPFIEQLNRMMQRKRNMQSSVDLDVDICMSPIAIEKEKSLEVTVQAFADSDSDFMKLNNGKLARQITYLDVSYFSAIKARECLGQSWKKKNKYEVAKHICESIDHFNRTAKWVQCRVLLAKNAKTRGRMIKKFIKICEELFALRNFQSLYAIYGALNSTAVMRLKRAWHYISTKHLAKFEEFKVIFASKKNMANLRKLHRETYPPMIPYNGIILQDLLSIEESSKMHKKDGSVNFARLLRLSTVIDSILSRQQAPYKINLDAKLQTLVKTEMRLNQNLSDDHIWGLSDKARSEDQKKKKNFVMFGAK